MIITFPPTSALKPSPGPLGPYFIKEESKQADTWKVAINNVDKLITALSSSFCRLLCGVQEVDTIKTGPKLCPAGKYGVVDSLGCSNARANLGTALDAHVRL